MILKIMINLGIPKSIEPRQVPDYLRQTLSVVRRGAGLEETRINLQGSQLPPDADSDQVADVIQSFTSPNFRIGIAP